MSSEAQADEEAEVEAPSEAAPAGLSGSQVTAAADGEGGEGENAGLTAAEESDKNATDRDPPGQDASEAAEDGRLQRGVRCVKAWFAPEGGDGTQRLSSLTPKYDPKQHGTYLRRLEEVVKDPKNLNIALTGRYGAGKSSVLEEFQNRYGRTAQRLAISTLAPDMEDEWNPQVQKASTNRIQKEIVKQLLYGAPRRVEKNSRYSRITVLTRRKAAGQAALAVTAVGALLFLLGWLPDIRWTNRDEETWVRVVAWAGVWVLATGLAATVRLATYGRFVSNVSAAGTTLSLTERPQTIFDKFLDEIVHYFDYGAKDIVIFEDLDRFDNPEIFEALRELNTLLNDTPRRRVRRRGRYLPKAFGWVLRRVRLYHVLDAKLSDRWAARILGRGVPLRFIYAVKDSLFERLGADTIAASDAGDAAAGETLRANRTKFFDVVVPLVPFISHRNARELLMELLEEFGITGIDKKLVNTVAQHSTDMRLLRNMCNEFLVFEERLLKSKDVAPGLDPSRLFALVAYKNFHLADFENIARQESDLDTLYDYHLRLVRSSIEKLEARNRYAPKARLAQRSAAAKMLGERVARYADALHTQPRTQGYRHLYLKVVDEVFDLSDAQKVDFWVAVGSAHEFEIKVSSNEQRTNSRSVVRLQRSDLEILFPESLVAGRWAKLDRQATEAELLRNERDLRSLRSADFGDLAQSTRFTLEVPSATMGEGLGANADETETTRATFADLVNATLKSPLAQDLVKRGYLDRNYSLYAAQFYGHFTGTDVATFMVQHVQTNTMNIDYDLSRPGAVKNLLQEVGETGEDLATTRVAYNIHIVDYLLDLDHPLAKDVVQRLVTEQDSDARTFLAAYFASGAHPEALAARLAAHGWQEVFVYLCADGDVSDDARASLVSAALVAAVEDAGYDLSDFGQFIEQRYAEMDAFTAPQESTGTAAVLALLKRTEAQLADLGPLHKTLMAGVVASHAYTLNAANLTIALDDVEAAPASGGISLDEVVRNSDVYAYCLDEFGDYIAAVDEDGHTTWAVQSPKTLAKVLTDLDGRCEDEAFLEFARSVAARTSPSSRLLDVTEAPASSWPALAGEGLFAPTLDNVHAYRTEVGEIDDNLAAVLLNAGAIDISAGVGDHDVDTEALAVLNAAKIADTGKRVALALSLNPSRPLPVDEITPEDTDLFAQLLAVGLVDDTADSFMHFRAGGWSSIGPAVKASSGIPTFVTPQLVDGMVGDLLKDPATKAKLASVVMGDLDSYAPDSDPEALRAVAYHAKSQAIALPPATVQRIAAAQLVEKGVILQLLTTAKPAATSQEIVSTFVAMGGDYAKVNNPGAKFTLPYDATHEDLLKTLKTDEIVSSKKKRLGTVFQVRTL